MIAVEDALALVADLVAPTPAETIPLRGAFGRCLAAPAQATLTQPPFNASAMDGYAVAGDLPKGTTLPVVGTAAAGHPFDGPLPKDAAVRIFTGAACPSGTTRVVIQENVTRDGDQITLTEDATGHGNIRAEGNDFAAGDQHAPGHPLTPADIMLLASMNCANVEVYRRPQVAILATGDELVAPGETPGPGQIVASVGLGLDALLRDHGAETRLLPIAKDTPESLQQAFQLAEGADLIITIGGASVGDHDLVAPTAQSLGAKMEFHKVAMRPGKPIMAGRLGAQALLGLPGNPVSAMVCARLFAVPMLRRMQGLAPQEPLRHAALTRPLDANGPRQHYLRARHDADGLTAFDRQDSALQTVLAASNALILRPPHAGPAAAGEVVPWLPL